MGTARVLTEGKKPSLTCKDVPRGFKLSGSRLMEKTVKLCLASVQGTLTCMTSPLYAMSLSISGMFEMKYNAASLQTPWCEESRIKMPDWKKKQWDILILSSRNSTYDTYKILKIAWKISIIWINFAYRETLSFSLSLSLYLSIYLTLSLSHTHTQTHTHTKKQKGKVIAAGRTGTYWGWRINVSTAFSQRITHTHTHTHTHTPTRTHTHITFHGSSVYRMLSAALYTVIKDHLQSFIICVSLSVDQHVCLFIFPPPSLFLFFPVGSSSSSFYIYVYFQFSSFLFFPPTPRSSLLAFPFLSHMSFKV